ncbi:hypothetical protein SDJN03_23890, partial [Cucurbita argyrosperma subsp. sororia]
MRMPENTTNIQSMVWGQRLLAVAEGLGPASLGGAGFRYKLGPAAKAKGQAARHLAVLMYETPTSQRPLAIYSISRFKEN